MRGHEVVVVGTGVLGMAIAVAAADAGLRVALVGPGYNAGGAASAAAGAMLGVVGEYTVADQDMTDLVFRHQSARLWPDWIEAITEHTGMRVPLGHGTVIIANLDHPADQDNLAAIRRAAQTLRLPVEDLDPRQVPGLRPAPRHAPVAALACPHEGWVNAEALLAALDTACRGHPGVDWVPGTARSVLVCAGTPTATGVALDDGTRVAGEKVVLAAGAASATLLAPLGALTGSLPAVLPAKGVSLMMEVPQAAQPPGVIRTPNRDFACGLHVIPHGGAGLYVGATNRFTTKPATGPTAGEHLSLLHGLLHQFRVDLRTATITGLRWGNRPATADGAPLIGGCGLPGLLLATGTYRNGILMAPAIAAIITAALLQRPTPVGNPYQPTARAARPQPDLRQLLVEGAAQMTSVLLDPDGALPYDRERQLSTTLASLLTLALANGQDLDRHRAQLRAQLAAHPTLEGVCRVFDTWETAT
ncbi:MAG: FAD-dependent oxidoreductase [Pseudonocardiaceae bacterium]